MIAVGDRLPSGTLLTMTESGPTPVDAAEHLGKGLVVLFAVPGAFTPTCSARHLPGYIEQAESLAGKGVDKVACVAVNDVFVMDAWGKSAGAGDKVEMLADGSGTYAAALGLTLDLTAKGLGMRSQRFALIARDGVVTHLFVEEGGAFEVSSAEHVLENL